MKKSFTFLMGAMMCCFPAISAESTETPEAPATESATFATLPEAEPEAEAEAAPQPPKSNWEKVLANLPKISGYLQTGWNWSKTSADGASASSSFQAKRLRLIMDGHVGEKIDFRLQIEAFNGIAGSKNGNGQKNIQVMDAFATWKIIPEFKLRFGQFYTPLGYENYDISPKTLETVDFSNIVYNMACRNPFSYNLVDYGRDLGVMLIGDAFDSGKGFRYLHYDVALTNGSIPCADDNNSSKDIYVSATVRPIKNFNVKATFNYGKYASTVLSGATGVGEGKYNPMHRFVVGAWYNDPEGLDLRAEYGLMKSNVNDVDVVDEQGAYALAGYHVGQWLPVVRWDMYKDNVNKTVAGKNYNRILLALSYNLTKNVTFQLNYGHFFYSDDAKEANGYDSSNQIQLMGRFAF